MLYNKLMGYRAKNLVLEISGYWHKKYKYMNKIEIQFLTNIIDQKN